MNPTTPTPTPVTFDAEQIYTLAEAKAMLKKNKGPLAGLRFYAENKEGQRVEAVVLPGLSAKGKVQATLKCLVGGPDHIREQSDWHQSLKSPASARKAAKAPEATPAPAAPAAE